MPVKKFLSYIDESATPLLSDGAMGTMLNARGVSLSGCFDALNLDQPGIVIDIHLAYLQTGVDVLKTNTFGANRYKLLQHGLADNTAEINQAGVKLAREAIASEKTPGKHIYVAGDVGPLGVRLAPFGRIQPEQARQVFQEQITALIRAGADLILIETFSDLHELGEAIKAARQVDATIPVVASLTYTRDDRTLLGDSPAQAASFLADAGADILGVNCSGGPAQAWRILRQMKQAVPGARCSVMPNAGWPEQVGGRVMYPANPEYFGEYALAFCEAGAKLVGGCCGTTPEHIAAMRRALDREPSGCGLTVAELSLPGEIDEHPISSEVPSNLAKKLADGKFVVSVEMDPPRGLSAHKLLAGASLLAEAGADVINVADSPMARMRMSPWAVCELVQRQIGVETVLHFPTRGRNILRVQGDLLAAHALGIRNLFVVMGDPTSIGDYPNAMDNYDLVPSGLIKLVKKSFNIGQDQAGADIGQPTTFFVGCALNLTPQDIESEIKNLRRKLQAGADFALTQPVFQPENAEAFLKAYTERHGPVEIPILVGILPLYSPRHASFLHNEVPGISIPEEIQERIRMAGERAPKEGVQIALELTDRMRAWSKGIYLMPQFNRYDLAAELIDGLS